MLLMLAKLISVIGSYIPEQLHRYMAMPGAASAENAMLDIVPHASCLTAKTIAILI
jgi:hypothetical protein